MNRLQWIVTAAVIVTPVLLVGGFTLFLEILGEGRGQGAAAESVALILAGSGIRSRDRRMGLRLRVH